MNQEKVAFKIFNFWGYSETLRWQLAWEPGGCESYVREKWYWSSYVKSNVDGVICYTWYYPSSIKSWVDLDGDTFLNALVHDWTYFWSYTSFTKCFQVFRILLRSSRPEVFCKKIVLRNFIHRKTPENLFLNEVTCLRPATLLKKRFLRRCFYRTFSTELLWTTTSVCNS